MIKYDIITQLIIALLMLTVMETVKKEGYGWIREKI